MLGTMMDSAMLALLMRQKIVALVLLCLSLPASALTRPILEGLDMLAGIRLPALESAVADALQRPVVKGRALDYALNVPLRHNLREHGQWMQRDDKPVWRLQYQSTGALSLSARLMNLQIPAGSILRIADSQGVVWHEITDLHQRQSYQSPIVPGASMVLEMEFANQAAANRADLHIRGVQHGYRPWRGGANDTAQTKSGSCNIDTACPLGDSWPEAIRATARITVNGTARCSAVLLNNTARDGTPLLLTADHCGLTASNADNTVVYWNFETSSCGGNPDGSLRQNQSGGTLLARRSDPDFALLRLRQNPPTSFDVYYAGWDSTGDTFNSGVSVHHPNGDEKRISSFNRRPRKDRPLVDGEPVQSWAVNWEQGVTEPGSSGSGLFDDLGRVVGQLSGGTSSCDNASGTDFYGRLDFGWTPSTDPAEQLRAWLDPIGSGERAIDGLDSSEVRADARADNYVLSAAPSRAVPLAVLINDSGLRPLRILSAQASSGQVEVREGMLFYSAGNAAVDDIEYQIMDRFGNVSQASATVTRAEPSQFDSRSLDSLRGGAAGWPIFVLLGLVGLYGRGRHGRGIRHD